MDALIEEPTSTAVDEDRCIGCGLCVTTCPSGALSLKAKEKTVQPPKDQAALYRKLLQERYGPLRAAAMAGRSVLGMKI
jgi:Fe-S-cluster-containing hydrogenase component 2